MSSRLRRRSVFARLALSYVIFVAIFVAMAIGVVSFYRKTTLETEVSRLNNESLDQYARLVNATLVRNVERLMLGLTLNSADSVLQLLARAYGDGSISVGELYEIYLRLNYQVAQSGVDAIHIYEPATGMLISTTYGARSVDSLSAFIRGNIPWLEQREEDGGYWISSRPYRFSFTGEETRLVSLVQTVQPSRLRGRRFLFSIDISEQQIRSSVMNESHRSNDAYLLTDEQGNIQFAVNPTLSTGSYQEIVNELRSQPNPGLRLSFGDERYAVSGSDLSNGWSLYRIVRMQEFFKVSDQLLLGIGAVSLLFLVVGAVISYFVSRYFYSPIASLEARILSLAGAREDPAPVGLDEFGRINTMLTSLDEELESFYRERQQALPRLKGNFVRSCIYNRYSSREMFMRDLDAIDRGHAGSQFCVIIVQFLLDRHRNASSRETAQMKRYLLNAVEAEGDRTTTFIASELDEATIAVIRRSGAPTTTMDVAGLRSRLDEHVGVPPMSLAFGRSYTQFDEIGHSYTEALQASKHQFFNPDRFLFGPDVISDDHTGDTGYFDRQGAALRKAIASRQFGEAATIVRESVNELAAAHSSYMAKEVSYHAISQILLSELFRHGRLLSSSEERVASYHDISDIQDFVRWSERVFRDLEEFYQDEKRVQRVQLVETVQQHIRDNLADDLSLTRLAEVTRLSNGYLSKLFAETTGTHINEYVQQIRMERARDMLVDTRSKIADIAAQCGYPTPHYFSKVFKEYYGKTPHSYRITRGA